MHEEMDGLMYRWQMEGMDKVLEEEMDNGWMDKKIVLGWMIGR